MKSVAEIDNINKFIYPMKIVYCDKYYCAFYCIHMPKAIQWVRLSCGGGDISYMTKESGMLFSLLLSEGDNLFDDLAADLKLFSSSCPD